MRLVADGKVDHAVAVDGVNGMIWDCEEKYSLKLSATVLKMYDGHRVKNLKLSKGWQVVHQRMKRKSNELK